MEIHNGTTQNNQPVSPSPSYRRHIQLLSLTIPALAMPDDVTTKSMENGNVDPSASSSDSDALTPQSLVKEEHVQAALAADKGTAASLTAWKVVDFTKPGDNYACVVSSVEVRYDLDGKSFEVVYVVKLNPCRTFESMKEFTYMAFQKEAKFYTDLIPEMNTILRSIGLKELKFPRCFYTFLEADKEVIFLEDLRPQGFKMTDRRQGLDEAHVILALRELARVHAASLLVEAQLPNKDIIARFPFIKKSWSYFIRKSEVFLSVFETQLKYSIDLLTKVGGYERAIRWIEDILPKIPDIIEEQVNDAKLKLVCHGDCWSNNMLFRYNEDDRPVEVMLLDVQLNNYSSPAIDLNYMLYTSTIGEVRQPNLQDFLSTYYSTFCSVLEAGNVDRPFTQAEFLQEFRDKNLYGVIYAMVLLPFMIVEPEDVIDLSTGTDEDINVMMEESQAKANELLDKNPLLRPRFLNVFDDMMESGVIP
ncbi:uncharacterized protein LOC126985540 [Eriocheir sinensis]|uniref:uncharacterized protein LOC126985540 n=1 Tax=Eriocheir sinensis TaxID=95602 RepID=UPI0021C7B4DF|nr:uncharacterized protein LOC126985540 [Eriocheir sinensis]